MSADMRCVGEEPTEWDYYGTEHAYRVCSTCPSKSGCLGAALLEGPIDQMRAGVAFGPDGKPMRGRERKARTVMQARARHQAWWRMHELGIAYAEIARRVGVHHTTVMSGVARVEAEMRGAA